MTLGGVDDWLKSELRRAERQGLLQGRHLSPVQFNAVVVLGYVDSTEKTERHLDELKKALLATGSYKAHMLFPDNFESPKDEQEESAPDAPLVGNPDYSDVEWQTPGENMAEFQRLMAEVAKLQDGKVSGDQVSTDPDEGWK